MNTKAPVLKPFNKDAVFEKVLKFYIGKGMNVEEANETAIRIVTHQMQERGMKI